MATICIPGVPNTSLGEIIHAEPVVQHLVVVFCIITLAFIVAIIVVRRQTHQSLLFGSGIRMKGRRTGLPHAMLSLAIVGAFVAGVFGIAHTAYAASVSDLCTESSTTGTSNNTAASNTNVNGTNGGGASSGGSTNEQTSNPPQTIAAADDIIGVRCQQA